MRLYYFIPVLIIIVCHLICILSLPITSQPLASNPEHLTWDAWQMPENSGRHPDHKAKKITPKSIFITPNFQTSASHTCPPDHKLDSNKRCIQIVKINEDELLANRIQALLGQTTSQSANEATDGTENGGDLYDYDYEEEDVENGPFQLNLPLTFEPMYSEDALPLKAGEETLLPFPAPHRPTHVDDTQTDAGTISYISIEKISNATDEEAVAPNSTTNGNGTTTNNDIRDSSTTGAYSTTSESNKFDSSTTEVTITGQTDRTDRTESDDPLYSSDSTESNTSSTNDDGLSSVTDISQTIPTTIDVEGTEKSSTEPTTTVNNTGSVTNDDNFSVTFVSNETSVLEEMSQAIKANTSEIFGDPFSEVVTGEMEWINYGNDTDDISEDAFLENESFIISNERVTTQKTDVTLEVNENGHTVESSGSDVDYPLPSSHTEEEHDISKEVTVTETTPLFIVTPQSTKKNEGNLWHPTLLQTPTRVHHKINGANNGQTTSITYPSDIEEVEKILLGPTNEQSTETKEREQAIKHEKNEAFIENLDSNNRFVYHYLTSSTTPKPSVVSLDHSNDRILNQIKEINRIVTENRLRHPIYPTKKQEPTRIRFPTDYHAESHSSITFPQTSDFASATGTRFAPSYNTYNNNNNNNQQYSNLHFGPSTTLVPPTTSAASPTTKPPFWWLPPGWQVDQSGQKPTLLRFWERMPLVRDPSMMQRSSSRSTRRENSRSPSENLYQEISAQDIYKVLQNSNRDWKHTNS